MRTRQAGQAAVEGVGITVLVALLLAATSAWLVQSVRPGTAPPVDPLADVGRPLAGAGDAIARAAPGLQGLLGARGGAGPIGRALRAAGRGIATGVVAGAEADRAFREGAQERLAERAREIWRDPLGSVVPSIPDAEDLTPGGIAVLVLEQTGAIADYARRLRTLPPRTAITTASRDLGRRSVDIGLALLQRKARRVLTGADRRPPGRAPAPPPDAPSP